MTLDDGGVYGQMTSSKIAQFRDFLYLKKLFKPNNFKYWYSGTILLHGQIVLHFT